VTTQLQFIIIIIIIIIIKLVDFHQYYLEARLIERSLFNSARTNSAELLRAPQLILQHSAARSQTEAAQWVNQHHGAEILRN